MTSTTATGYLVSGGSAELERLRLQARVSQPAAEQLLDQIGIAPGWRCLDLGCGGMGNRSRGLPDRARGCLLNSRGPVRGPDQCLRMPQPAAGLLQELLQKKQPWGVGRTADFRHRRGFDGSPGSPAECAKLNSQTLNTV